MTFTVWIGFLLAAILIAVTPGPGAVISMSTGMLLGYRRALLVILGLQVAILTHIAVIAVGVGALLAGSELAFGLVKSVGAGYLVWLGVQKWRAPPTPVGQMAQSVRGDKLFLQGLLVNLTNPKAVIFVGALVPQFIDPASAQLPQYLTIAATLCLTDILVMSAYAIAAARLGGWMQDPGALRHQNRLFGALFVCAGGLLAFASRVTR